MELVVSDNKLKKIGSFETKAFQIKASAKAFQILSDSLYSDKYAAIIRELSCNAVDIHKSINQTKKYEIHLPSWHEPNFWIRDYGTGLTKEQIESIYTTYFESTKNDSNDYIGCLGLGSKTPFSYTSQFTITSFFNGKKYAYSAFINDEDGCPSVALLGETNTDEPDGLKIEFAVKREDHDNFYLKADDVFLWFNDHPIIKGYNINLKKIEEHYIFNGINWHIYNSQYGSILNGRAYARMGNIGYPIDASKLPSDFSYKEYTLYPIILDMDIGDIDVAPSREALSYNKKTVASLSARFQKFIEELSSSICKELEEQISLGNACHYANKKGYFNNPLLSLLIDAGTISYHKKPLKRYISSYELEKTIPDFYQGVEFLTYDGTLKSKINTHYYSSDWKLIDIDQSISKTKLREVLLFNKINNAYLIQRKLPLKIREAFIDLLGYGEDKIILSSELKIPPKEEKKKNKTLKISTPRKTGSQAWIYHGAKYGYIDGRPAWGESGLIDFSESNKQEYVYMKLENFQPHNSEKNAASFYFRGLEVFNLEKTISLFGLTERQFSKIENQKNWIHISEYLKQKCEENFKILIDECKNYREKFLLRNFCIDTNEFFGNLPKHLKLKKLYDALLISKKDFYELKYKLENYSLYLDKDNKEKCQKILDSTLSITIENFIIEEPDCNLSNFIKEYIKYPMLKNHEKLYYFNEKIGSLINQSNEKLWIEYIENIEKLEKKDSN